VTFVVKSSIKLFAFACSGVFPKAIIICRLSVMTVQTQRNIFTLAGMPHFATAS